MRDACEAFNILRTLLRDHYEGRVKEKIDPRNILTKEEEVDLVEYTMEMVKVAHPLSVTHPKMKVAEICQQRPIHFKDGIVGKS